MAEESKIAMKLEEEMKPLKKMCEKLMDAANHELEKGIESVNAEELGEVVDMIKDIYKAKKEIAETCYYKSVMEAMEEHDFEGEEEIMDDGRRGYRGQPRSKTSGRFMSRGDGRRSNRGRRGYEEPWDEMYDEMEYMRDMDRPSMNRMYFSGSGSNSGMSGQSSSGSGMNGGNMGGSSGGSSGGSRGYSEGSRYENARRGYEEKKQSGADKQEKMKSLEEYMKELGSDLSSLLSEMSPEEKTMVRVNCLCWLKRYLKI